MSLQGTVVFSSGKHGDYDIYTLNLKTREIKQLTSGDTWNKCPKWSPDGQRIVFISNRSGTQDIWVMNADGSEQERITKDDRWHHSPDWSPDGTQLVFAANYDGNINIYSMKIDGSDLKQITKYPEMDSTPQYSPSGDKIIFSSRRSNPTGIWVYDIFSGQLDPIVISNSTRNYAPTYSPEGDKIAFISGVLGVDGKENLAVHWMDKNGQNSERLTINTGDDRHVGWSPDSKYLIYTAGKSGAAIERLHVIELATKKVEQLEFDRTPLELDIEAEPKGLGLFKFFPESWLRKMYPEIYFGTEQYPDWKL